MTTLHDGGYTCVVVCTYVYLHSIEKTAVEIVSYLPERDIHPVLQSTLAPPFLGGEEDSFGVGLIA
jgi:hypothetical protein